MDTDCAAAGEDRGGSTSSSCAACGMWRVPFVEIALNRPKRCRKYNYGCRLLRSQHDLQSYRNIHKESLKSMRLQALLNCNRQTFRSSECTLCPCLPLSLSHSNANTTGQRLQLGLDLLLLLLPIDGYGQFVCDSVAQEPAYHFQL